MATHADALMITGTPVVCSLLPKRASEQPSYFWNHRVPGEAPLT